MRLEARNTHLTAGLGTVLIVDDAIAWSSLFRQPPTHDPQSMTLVPTHYIMHPKKFLLPQMPNRSKATATRAKKGRAIQRFNHVTFFPNDKVVRCPVTAGCENSFAWTIAGELVFAAQDDYG